MVPEKGRTRRIETSFRFFEPRQSWGANRALVFFDMPLGPTRCEGTVTSKATGLNAAPSPTGLVQRSAEDLSDAVLTELIPVSALQPSERSALLREGTVVGLAPGAVVSLDKLCASQAVYVLSGRLVIRCGSQIFSEIAGGTLQARFSLTQCQTRAATVVVKEGTELLCLDMSLMSRLLLWTQTAASAGLAPANDHKPAPQDEGPSLKWLPGLLASELFSSIPNANLHRLFEIMQPVTVRDGETVICQDEPGIHYYVIRQGEFVVTRTPADGQEPYQLATLGPGDSFGEEALVSAAHRSATVTAQGPGALFRLTKEDFITLIAQPGLPHVAHKDALARIDEGSVWLDVRLAEEHRNDGFAGSVNVPLHQLWPRMSKLSRDTRYIVYCNRGQRSAAACGALRKRGFEACVLDGGLLGHIDTPAPPTPKPGSEQRLQQVLTQAHAEMDAAFRSKIEATAERRVFAKAIHRKASVKARDKRELARIRAKLKRLELQSHAASQALSQAQRKRLEAEAALRAERANAEKAWAQAEVRTEPQRLHAEEKLGAEQTRIREGHSRRGSRIAALSEARASVQREFEHARRRIEAKFAARLGALEEDETKLTQDAARAEEDGECLTEEMRADQSAAARTLRTHTETQRRKQREHLERQFAAATRGVDSANRHLTELQIRRDEADQEARAFSSRLHQATQTRRHAAQTARKMEEMHLQAQVQATKARAQHARAAKAKAERERQTVCEEIARLRAQQPVGSAPSSPEAPGEATLRTRLATRDAQLMAAQIAVAKTERAARVAESTATTARIQAAEETAAEQELQRQLHAEAEAWRAEENHRSEEALEAAKRQAEEMARARFESDARKTAERSQDIGMISDIQAQLEVSGEPNALTQVDGNSTYAERRAAATLSARERADEEKAKAHRKLARARAHIERLKQRR